MKTYGLIGHPLSHSFSQKYFTEKFLDLGIRDCQYELFDLNSIEEFESLISSNKGLAGLNVTIPYKEAIMPFLDGLDVSATQVGAVNVLKNVNGAWVGYNSDYYGFKQSLQKWLPNTAIKALVLGTGGASKAILAVLRQLNIPHKLVSRSERKSELTYERLHAAPELMSAYRLIINTTPVGMYPNAEASPDLDYSQLTGQHFLYDLVYNPEETAFMMQGEKRGSQTKNGLEMLELQAEKSWEIWNTNE
jgi:shikimate dehydrogenase